MENAQGILVITLGIFLAVFLLLAINALIIMVRILKSVRRIFLTIESATDNLDSAIEVLKKSTGPVAVGKIILSLYRASKSDKKSRHKG